MEQGAWIPFKELWNVTQEFALHHTPASFHKLKILLRRHKPEFVSLLKNVLPSHEHREKVKKATTVGLTIEKEPGNAKVLEQSLIDEAIILSDIFKLNELACVDLLQAGEQQVPNYPNYSRGLVAVLLYWDGRRNLVNVLRTLIQCRKGRAWTLGLSEEASTFATAFTDDLLKSGMTKKILALLTDIEVEAELEKLSQQRGLGDAKHRKQIRDLISDIRQCLAECLFYFGGQSGLPANDVVDIIHHLQKTTDSEADGKLSSATMALLFSVLYSFNLPCDCQSESDEKSIEDLLGHPLLSDAKFLPMMQKVLLQEGPSSVWKVPGLRACLKFGWSICLRNVSQVPSAIFTGSSVPQPNADILEQDENVLEASLAERVFLFIKDSIVSWSGFHAEEFYVRRLHGLITDLIVNMPLKIKDMRNHGDEVARIVMLHLVEGEDPPPELRKDFEQLLQLVTCLYNKDPLDLQLASEFWCPNNDSSIPTEGGTYIISPSKMHQRISHKQIALFKFIRQSGDLLPPLLYIPYLRMLAALATGARSARVAFEMLKSNSSNTNGNGENSTVSWDHFFMSCQRYYTNLRQDRPTQDPSNPFAIQQPFVAQASQARSITPQEVEGLRAVMKLIAKIMQYDDIACITLYEHSRWSACAVLFGLLQCPIPVALKGDILDVLTQLSRIPDVALGVLQGLESAQFLRTAPDTWRTPGAATKSVGILSELEEIESRDEEFPMSQGFLKLLCTLVESGANLSVLGEGTRSPGFGPYLSFAVESVFLKAPSRAYARPEEKWSVASCCLQLFNSVLLQYQPHPEHFISTKSDMSLMGRSHVTQHSSFTHDSTLRTGPSAHESGKVPGFSLLLYLYNEGNFFKTVMHIVTECIAYLDKYAVKKSIEESLVEATSLAMQLLFNALQLQDAFLTCMRESGKPLLITSLDKLLLGANSKSGKADYMVCIARFLIHNATHSQLCLLAAKIISWLCLSSVATQREVVMTMVNSCALATRRKILHGFVEVLDSPCVESEEDASSHLSQCRLSLLRLLVYCVDLPSPNLSQFLLGFDIAKPTSAASLQDPGILGTPRSCLHSVLTILSAVDDQGRPSAVVECPKLAELCYQLLYRLSANPDTTGPIMRYLRSSYDFVHNHLQNMVLNPTDLEDNNSCLMQQAWLLKMTAIELYSLASRQQRSNAQRILKLLFDVSSKNPGAQHQQGTRPFNSSKLFGQTFDLGDLSSSRAMFGAGTSASTTFLDVTGVANFSTTSASPRGGTTESMKVLRILDVLDFSQTFPERLVLEQFVPTVVEQAIQSCETTNEHGVEYCDVKALHKLLKASLSTLSGADDVSRRQLANQDVQRILHAAVERNRTRESIHAKLSFLCAWRQALEVSLTACPVELYPNASRQQIMFEITNHIIGKVRHSDAVQELTSPVASAILTLVMQIRACFTNQKSTITAGALLETPQLAEILSAENETEVDLNDVAPLQVVVRGIVEWLLQFGISEKVRTHLYAALLYYMQLCRRPKTRTKGRRETVGVLASFEDAYAKINRENLKLIKDYGDSFMNLICKDACNGQNVCRVLALACLDSITQIDSQQTWLQHMTTNGSLAHISHSITAEDESLQQYLNPASEPLRVVYIYEQKMALLCSLVRSHGGARAVIDSGVVARLSECAFLDMRPNSENEDFSTFLPAIVNRYRQLLLPALQLCAGLLATLGGSNHAEASALVLQFLLSHTEAIINSPLRFTSIPTDIQALNELNLVTSILSQTAAQDYSDPSVFGAVPQAILVEIQGHLLRIQRQLLSILPRFFSDLHFTDVKSKFEQSENQGDFEQVTSTLHEIGGNVLSYCRSVALRAADSSDSTVLLFAPDLSDSLDQPTYGGEDHRRQPALGILLPILRSVLSHFIAQSEEKKRQLWTLENVASLNAQELKEIVSFGSQHLSLNQEHDLATAVLKKSIRTKESHLERLYFIMENCLLLLWQHLDYYVLRAAPAETGSGNILFPDKAGSESFSRSSLRRLQDISNLTGESFLGQDAALPSPITGKQFGVRRVDIDKLKNDLPPCLPDSFLQKLSQIEVQVKGSAGFFVQPLVRKLQHIVKLHAAK